MPTLPQPLSGKAHSQTAKRLVRGFFKKIRPQTNAQGTSCMPYSRDATSAQATRYFHQDHLGSIAVITDEAGLVVERLAYDPWGKRRFANGTADTQDSIVGLTMDRGYTEHEHLDEVGVIHMNGRIYDPLMGRFMSADPFIQAPFELQSHNRYSYVMNNPLGYTDPSGYFSLFNEVANLGSTVSRVWRQDVYPSPITQIVVTAFAYSQCGAGCAAYVSAGYSAASTYDRTGSLDQAAKAGLISYGTTLAFSQVGDIAPSGIGNVVGHAAVGCASSVASGGTCRSGALAGAAGSAWSNYGVDYGNLAVDTVAHAVVGGVGSALGGGKFQNGAVTAAYGYLFNAVAHNLDRFEGRDGFSHINSNSGMGVTFINDVSGAPQTDRAIDTRLATAIDAALNDTNFSANINSTTGGHVTGPHKAGRGADINMVNGIPVENSWSNAAALRLAETLASQPSVSQVISPVLSVNISATGVRTPITNQDLLNQHSNHIHVGVRPP